VAEIKNTKQKQAHLRVQQCISKIELLENQSEQIRKLKLVCLESKSIASFNSPIIKLTHHRSDQKEVFYRSQAAELQLLSRQSAELKSPSPRLEEGLMLDGVIPLEILTMVLLVTADHSNQIRFFETLMSPGSEALVAPPHYDSQIADLKTELETLKEELFQFPSSAQTSGMTLSESGQYISHPSSANPAAPQTSSSFPNAAVASKPPPVTASSSTPPASTIGNLKISGINEIKHATSAAIPPPPPPVKTSLPSANVRSDILAAIESFSQSKTLKKTVTKVCSSNDVVTHVIEA